MSRTDTEIPISKVDEAAQKWAKQAKGGDIFALSGDLGSGKTTFTKALGKALGVRQTITSPTFVLMQEFATAKPSSVAGRNLILYHLDLYRTNSFKEVESLGIAEIWGHPETITVIEWAEKIDKQLPPDTIRLHFYRDDE